MVNRYPAKHEEMDGHDDSTSFLDLFASSPCPGVGAGSDGLEAHSNGFQGIAGTAEQGEVFDLAPLSNAFGNKDLRVHQAQQYAGVEILSTSYTYSPGALVRGDSANRDDYGLDPVSFAGGVEIFEHDGGTWGVLATGGGTLPGVNNFLWIEADGNSLEAFVDGSSEVSTTDSSLPTGDVGAYSYQGAAGTAIGGPFHAGSLAINPKAVDYRRNNVLRNRQGRGAQVRRERLRKIVRR